MLQPLSPVGGRGKQISSTLGTLGLEAPVASLSQAGPTITVTPGLPRQADLVCDPDNHLECMIKFRLLTIRKPWNSALQSRAPGHRDGLKTFTWMAMAQEKETGDKERG